MPPTTIVSPSLTRTLAIACLLISSKGITPEEPTPDEGLAVGATELDFTPIFIRINPSEDTWGVTVRVMPVGICSVATAVPAAAPLPLAIFVDEGRAIRRIRKACIVDSTLLRVATEGLDITFTSPSFSAAVNVTLRSVRPPTLF
jgi:hypothetical protein